MQGVSSITTLPYRPPLTDTSDNVPRIQKKHTKTPKHNAGRNPPSMLHADKSGICRFFE